MSTMDAATRQIENRHINVEHYTSDVWQRVPWPSAIQVPFVYVISLEGKKRVILQ